MKRMIYPVTLSLVLLAMISFVAAQSLTVQTISRYAPEVETLLLENGYEKNIIEMRGVQGLRASQRSYTASIWSRDLDYAISGYSFALKDMRLFRQSITLFLDRVDASGVVPEAIHLDWPEGSDYENRQCWDSMPNVIHAVYVYVAKTGDIAFYQQHRDTLQRVGTWIVMLDRDGDGLPDQDTFPYGYYDSVKNGVMHTYALAKFYTAFNELADLERSVGNDGSVWEQHAAQLRQGFHRPFDEGGYWYEGQAWPIAWRHADGSVVNVLETFGVFEALRSGLISPADGDRYTTLVQALHTHTAQLTSGVPMKLTLDGYPDTIRREVDPPVPLWMMDASAPWITGLAAPAYAQAGYPQDAATIMSAYMNMAQTTNPPVLEFVAGQDARYGPGNSGDGGRTWDSAAWFLAVYGGHYGLTMTPSALVVHPSPFETIPGDGISNLVYQDALIQLDVAAEQLTYRIQADRSVPVLLQPMGTSTWLRVNGSSPQEEASLILEPGQEYVVVSEGGALDDATTPGAPPPYQGFFASPAFQNVWARTDFPLQRPIEGLEARSWMWGPQPLSGSFSEPYQEGSGGTRLVQYFDKSRMEINDPNAPQDQWYVTNGLLVVEMIEGKVQVGDTAFEERQPADEAVAGDPRDKNPNAPTYRSFRSVAYPLNQKRADNRQGEVVTAVLHQDGSTSDDAALARYQVTLGSYEEQLGHNVPAIFNDFFGQRGIVFENGRYVQGALMDHTFVMGLPISEPFWARVNIGGQEKDVLIQAFERRVLTYTPANELQWRVEMGNVGQHYVRWRYLDAQKEDVE